jgi:hypothetical protein
VDADLETLAKAGKALEEHLRGRDKFVGKDQPGYARYVIIVSEALTRGCEPAGVGDYIVVEEGNVLTLGDPKARVSCS